MQIQNQDATRAIINGSGLTITEGIPQNLLPNVQPVMDMTPRFHRRLQVIAASGATSGATATIFTTSSTRRTFIVGYQYFAIKDATCDGATALAGLRTTVNGVASYFYTWYQLTLTAQQVSESCLFKEPLEADKGVTVQFTQSTFTAGNFARAAVIYYYETD